MGAVEDGGTPLRASYAAQVSTAPQPPGLTVFGFPLRVSPIFWVVAVFFGFPAGAEEYSTELFLQVGIWVGVLFVSILWHELGHAFAMRRFGYSPSIELYGMGGRTMWGRGPAHPSPGKRIVVSLAGPFFGFLLGGAMLLVDLLVGDTGQPLLDYFFGTMMWVNVGWGVLNLVPMLPWDGGHVMEGVFDLFTKGKGRKPAAVVTIALSVLIALAVFAAWGIQQWWILFLCLLSLSIGVRVLRAKPASQASRSLDPMSALAQARKILERAGPPERLVSAILMGSASDDWRPLAADLEERVADKVVSPTQRAMALELSAWAHLLAGDPERALGAVEAMQPTHDPSPILAAIVAIRNRRFEEALEAIEAIHPEEREGAKRLEAYALAALGRPEPAMVAIEGDHGVGSLVDAALFGAGLYDAAADFAMQLFDRFGEAEDAYNAACSHARAGRPEEGLMWLERAVDAGYRDLEHLDADDDLAAIRDLEGFGPLRERLET